MDRIVVGFDGSEASRAALRWAVAEAKRRSVALSVRTVLTRSRRGGTATPSRDATDTAEAALGEIAAEIVGAVPAEHRLGPGAPAAELVAACAPGDLLVVGARARGGVPGALLGSVSRACLHTAPCPVVVVPPGPVPSAGDVVVGVDGSPAARRALLVAGEEAELRGCELEVVHAVHWDHYGGELIAPTERDLIDWGTHLVESQLAETGVAGRPVVVPGRVTEVLVEQSRRAGLLVVGSRGLNPLTQLLLGSTARYCAQHASCPVMVVRPPTPAAG